MFPEILFCISLFSFLFLLLLFFDSNKYVCVLQVFRNFLKCALVETNSFFYFFLSVNQPGNQTNQLAPQVSLFSTDIHLGYII